MALRLISRAALPLPELSGLAVREGARGRELLCVGDHDHDLLSVPLGADGAIGRETRHDLRALLGASGASGFEGVACDGAGRVVVLQEGPSRALALAADLSRLEGVIEMRVEADQPGFGREWQAHDNARGEGLLVMERGHLLVAKQRDPACLIEFGPPADAPVGVSPETLLRADDPALPLRLRGGTVDYAVLAWWALAGRSADRVESVNDLALDAEGRVLLVSSRSRGIARLEAPLDPGVHEAAIDNDWRLPNLPGRGGRRPEALCAAPDALLVGLDTRGSGDNLVALEPPG
jgi:hypothetical protein